MRLNDFCVDWTHDLTLKDSCFFSHHQAKLPFSHSQCYAKVALSVTWKDYSSEIIWQCIDVQCWQHMLPINGRMGWWKELGNTENQQNWGKVGRTPAHMRTFTYCTCTHTHAHSLRLTPPSTLNKNDTGKQTSVLAAEAWNCLSFLLLIVFHTQWNKKQDPMTDSLNVRECVCVWVCVLVHICSHSFLQPLHQFKRDLIFCWRDWIYAWRLYNLQQESFLVG